MSLISIIVALVILGAVLYILSLLPIDALIKRIIYVVICVAAFLWILSAFGFLPHGSIPLR